MVRGGGGFHREDHVGFSVRRGGFVPRSAVLYDLPSEFIEIVPEYRGYRYVEVGDELVIIDPYTFEIVAIIPV